MVIAAIGDALRRDRVMPVLGVVPRPDRPGVAFGGGTAGTAGEPGRAEDDVAVAPGAARDQPALFAEARQSDAAQ